MITTYAQPGGVVGAYTTTTAPSTARLEALNASLRELHAAGAVVVVREEHLYPAAPNATFALPQIRIDVLAPENAESRPEGVDG